MGVFGVAGALLARMIGLGVHGSGMAGETAVVGVVVHVRVVAVVPTRTVDIVVEGVVVMGGTG